MVDIYRSTKSDFKIDFIGIGAPKTASSWFYEALRASPNFNESFRKEVTYFSSPAKYKRGINWYEGQFNSNYHLLTGEFSVTYCYEPEKTAERIFKAYPDTTIILIVRDPKERSISHYRWLKQLNEIPADCTFSEAVALNPEIITCSNYEHVVESYLKFFSIHQILIIQQISINYKPLETVNEFFRHFGLSHGALNKIKKAKVGKTISPRSKYLESLRIKIYKKLLKHKLYRVTNFIKFTRLPDLYRNLNDSGSGSQLDIETYPYAYSKQIKFIRSLGIKII